MEKRQKVNLNHADKDQLMALPGFDEELAARVIAYRREHGGFKTLDEVRNVGPLPGITLDDIRREAEI